MNHEKYSSIRQFRHVVKDIHDFYGEGFSPKLIFKGTVKAHGTNASVLITNDGIQYPQSRSNILTIENDNYGFAKWHCDNTDAFTNFKKLINFNFTNTIDRSIVIYGEWCGKGIQKGVAISECEKFFYVFGVKVLNGDMDGTHYWLNDYLLLSNKDSNIIDAREIKQYFIDIDFKNPHISQDKLIEITNEVEKKCPIGEYYGINGAGEGVVWENIDSNGRRLSFKVKSKKHSVTKVKKLAEVDIEKLNSIQEFIDYAVTENRLEQALLETCGIDPDRKLLGKFIKWVSDDVLKEEGDTLESNNLTIKDIGYALSKKSKKWFFDRELI